MATLKLEIITPDSKIFEDDVDSVQLPGTEGEMGILPGHMALVSALNAGALVITQKGQTHTLAIGEGFAEITATSVGVLTDGAINEKDIDEKKGRGSRQARRGPPQEQHPSGRRTRSHPGLPRPLPRPDPRQAPPLLLAAVLFLVARTTRCPGSGAPYRERTRGSRKSPASLAAPLVPKLRLETHLSARLRRSPFPAFRPEGPTEISRW